MKHGRMHINIASNTSLQLSILRSAAAEAAAATALVSLVRRTMTLQIIDFFSALFCLFAIDHVQ